MGETATLLTVITTFVAGLVAAVYGVMRDAGIRERSIREDLFKQNQALSLEIERLRSLLHELECTVLQRGHRVQELEAEVAHLRHLLIKHGIDPGDYAKSSLRRDTQRSALGARAIQSVRKETNVE